MHAFRQKLDADFPFSAAHNLGLGDIGQLGKPGQHLFSDSAKIMIIIFFRIKGEVHYGDIVNLNRLDHPALYNVRCNILIHGHLTMNLHKGLFTVFSHKKPDRYHRQIITGHGIDILHPVDLPQ